jgi:UDP-N-acetylmuramoyl-tripeptide--D-alanyl-D-alanine ligase
VRRSLAEIAAALGLVAPAATATVTGVAIDSRSVRPGDLFVALAGERADGHDFLADAREHGAAAALVVREVPVDLPQLAVPDTTLALQRLARAEREAAAYQLVGITGSVGKTTSKQFLATLLATTFHVGATRGSRNSQAGFPAELCNQPSGLDWFVAEMGMSRAGELDRLGALSRPDAVLVTAIAPAHLEFFPDLDAIAEAKAELIRHLPADGVLVLNAADPRVAAMSERYKGRTVLYGAAGTSALWIEAYTGRGLSGAAFRLTGPGAGRSIEVDWGLAGRHQAENLLAATCCALALGVPPDAVSGSAGSMQASPRRGEVHRLPGGALLVDDSYNASPTATMRLLDLLAQTRGRRIAVLGEMLELGPTSTALHREVGARAAAVADLVLAVGGPPAGALAAAAGGLHVANAEAALALLRDRLEAGDVVLVKGSRGIGLDAVVDGLLGRAP